MSKIHYFKLLNKHGISCSGGKKIQWHLPTKTNAGKWMPKLSGYPALCSYGYHLVDVNHIYEWDIPKSRVFLVEFDGDLKDKNFADVASNKIAICGPMRLVQELPWEVAKWGAALDTIANSANSKHVIELVTERLLTGNVSRKDITAPMNTTPSWVDYDILRALEENSIHIIAANYTYEFNRNLSKWFGM
jgi:hypothetical protein